MDLAPLSIGTIYILVLQPLSCRKEPAGCSNSALCVDVVLGDVAAKKYEWGIASDARLISIAEVIVILFLLRGQASQLIHKIRENVILV